MIAIAALFLVLAFMLLLGALGVPARAAAAVQQCRAALAVLRRKDLDDLAKEKALQAHSRALFRSFAVITLRSAAALLLPAAVVWLGSMAGLYRFEDALEETLSWPILVGACAAGVLLWWWGRRR